MLGSIVVVHTTPRHFQQSISRQKDSSCKPTGLVFMRQIG
jgi:hypothetical protein